MTTTQFDATAYKANQCALWNAQSAVWESWFGEFELARPCALVCTAAISGAD